MRSVKVSTVNATATSAKADWVRIVNLSRSTRSATTPPQAPSSRTGKNWAAVTTPRAMPLSVSWSTSQITVTVCIHVPDWLTS